MVCVGGLLVRDGRVLLGLRSAGRTHYPDVWDVFGGHACPGERPHDTLVRELQEELGVTPTSVTLLHIAQYAEAVEACEYRIYLITAWEGTPENRQLEEHSEISWVSPEQFHSMRLAHPGYVGLFQQAVELADPAASNGVG